MKSFKKIMIYVLTLFMLLQLAPLSVKAEELTGDAYAVLTAEGDLIFFRSTDTYAHKKTAKVRDINGAEFEGTVFTNVEKDYNWSIGKYADYALGSYSDQVKRVYVAEGNTIHKNYMGYLVSNCENLESFDGEGFDTSEVKDFSYMLYGCRNLKELNLSSWNTENAENMAGMFSGLRSLEALDLSNFNTSKVTNMDEMFSNLDVIKTLKISNLDTSKVTNMNAMFRSMGESMPELDLRWMDTSSCTTMEQMFGYSKVKKVNLSSFRTHNVTSMHYMFARSSIESLDLSSFDTSNVVDFSNMFDVCRSLKSVKVTSFDTSKATTMHYMFSDCSALTTLDLRSFDTLNVTDFGYMFDGDYELKTIYATEKFDTRNQTIDSNMFGGCEKLKGGNGTAYSMFHVESDYARIDKPGQPGYFTYPVVEPEAPQIEAENLPQQGIRLSWAKADYADQYTVYRKSGSGSYSQIGTTKELYYLDSTVKPGVSYSYVVTSYNEQAKKTSPYSNTLTLYYNPFNDVSTSLGNTTFKSIMWAVEKGIVKGTSDDKYSPSDNCTRAQLCVMLWRLAGKPAVNVTDNPFPDVSSTLGNTTYKAILWAYQKGIVKGNKDGTFNPNGNTTRANMAVMLWRMANKPTISATDNPFEDVSTDLGNTTYKAILWAYDVGLTKGTDATHFSPSDPCTRAQLAVFLYRLNNLYHYM